MGQIQTSVGLITGIPITDTVDKLMALAARPRDLIAARNTRLQAEQVAVTDLTSLVLGVQFATDQLGDNGIFSQKTVTSQDSSLISATLTGDPVAGSYSLVPVRQAQPQQVFSSGVNSLSQTIGAGALTFQFGRHVDRGIALEQLNAGAGVQRGLIRITDRSGNNQLVDLSFAQTIDDVIESINGSFGIDVTAAASGDAIRLTDHTGQTVSNLSIRDVGGGTTAADLGLAGVNVAAATATGADVLRLGATTRLEQLGDGTGVAFLAGGPDLDVTFRDGSLLSVDFGRIGLGPDFATATTTAANGPNAQIDLTAVQKGSQSDNVTVVFVDDLAVTKGNETVVYDNSDPANKTLTFHIDAGQSTANDVIAALNGDPVAGQVFTAAVATGGDGTGLVDVADTAITGGGAPIEATLGTVLNVLNTADPARLQASITADGDHLQLTDLTSGGGTFSVASTAGGSTAEDLGLTPTAVGGVLTGQRLLAGLKTSFVSSLNGGNGLGTLGQIQITDRAGTTATVDLSTAETLAGVIDAINAAPIGIQAGVNDARTGLVLRDTTGSTVSNLRVVTADATLTAEKLGIAADIAQTEVDGGSLHLQSISRATQLSDLNGGEGVFAGTFQVFDSNLAFGVVKLNQPGAEITTVGGVIDAINNLGIGVQARINDTGDGILVLDTAGGTQTLQIKDLAGGTTAADLNLAGTAKVVTVGGTPTPVIDGSSTVSVPIAASDTLSDLVTNINNLGAGFQAAVFNDGSALDPYRISITRKTGGERQPLLIESGSAGIDFQEVVRGQDALLLVGSANSPGAGVLASSPTNTFDGVIDGVTLNIEGTSNKAVNVAVATTGESVVSAAQGFVDAFNALVDKIDKLTFFNDVDNTTGVLFGSNETLRVETQLDNLVTGRFTGVGRFQTLAAVGITVDDQGKLSLDSAKLQTAFTDDPKAVTDFFSTKDLGVSAKFNTLIESLAGPNSSLLVRRAAALADTIKTNQGRIDLQDKRLSRERERLLKEFFRIEEIVSKLRGNLTTIQSFQAIPPLSIGSSGG